MMINLRELDDLFTAIRIAEREVLQNLQKEHSDIEHADPKLITLGFLLEVLATRLDQVIVRDETSILYPDFDSICHAFPIGIEEEEVEEIQRLLKSIRRK